MNLVRTVSHCWVCDDHGGLYVLTDVGGEASTNTKMADHKWKRVDEGFKSVYAGYDGLVCGIKNFALHIRKGVTPDNPVGTEWVRYECDILKAVPGRLCVVRKSSKRNWYVAKIEGCDTSILDWRALPLLDCAQGEAGRDMDEVMYQCVVDYSDRLFSVSSIGEVCCCELLETGDLHWTPITGPPSVLKETGFVGRVLNFWRAQDSISEWVSMVSAGVGSLWCLKEQSNQVWQIVIGQLNGKYKVNWVKAELPLYEQEEIVAMSGCKSSRDGLYLIVKEEGHYKMVSCSLSAAEDCGRVEIGLPVRYPHNCVAVCSTPVTKVESSRKRSISDQNCHSSSSKRAKIGDEMTFTLSGIEIVYNESFLTSKYCVDQSLFLSPEDISTKYDYDFSLENDIIQQEKI